MSIQDRVKRLEAIMIPQEVDYGEIYDFLFSAEMTIGAPPGSFGEDEALRRLGDRTDFINDRRTD
jgi:hypothetical protein